jgi:hypothetical protein
MREFAPIAAVLLVSTVIVLGFTILSDAQGPKLVDGIPCKKTHVSVLSDRLSAIAESIDKHEDQTANVAWLRRAAACLIS